MADWFSEFKDTFYVVFIEESRWKYIVNGIGFTLRITLAALVLGIVIGILVAIVRSTHEKNGRFMKKGFGTFVFRVINWLCGVYLTVIRGTPVVLQLLIMNFVIFTSRNSDVVLVASLTFGINSGAYVAEIFRGGIMSVDSGQFEAGRSLGFGYIGTMLYIIIPQALKNAVPALGNEFIVLLKETSVSGYIGTMDLAKGADVIRGRTFVAFLPLFGAAVVYLSLVMLLTKLVSIVERRLRNSER